MYLPYPYGSLRTASDFWNCKPCQSVLRCHLQMFACPQTHSLLRPLMTSPESTHGRLGQVHKCRTCGTKWPPVSGPLYPWVFSGLRGICTTHERERDRTSTEGKSSDSHASQVWDSMSFVMMLSPLPSHLYTLHSRRQHSLESAIDCRGHDLANTALPIGLGGQISPWRPMNARRQRTTRESCQA